MQKFTRQTRIAHRYLMIIVGIQLFIWAASGTYMVWLNIHSIHGDEWFKSPPTLIVSSELLSPTEKIPLSAESYSISELVQQYPKALNIQLKMLGNRPVYLFEQFSQPIMLDATNGKKVAPLTKPEVIALLPFVIDKRPAFFEENIKHIDLLIDSVPEEISGRGLPLWQIELKGWDNTTIYISQKSGEVQYVRHNRWRIFDLLWRLHIMDYTEGEDVGNKLLIFTTVLSFLAAITGLVLLTLRLRVYRVEKSAKRLGRQQDTSIAYSARIRNFIKRTHKWFALIVFVQLLIWMVSGFLLGQVDYDVAAGKPSKASSKYQQEQAFLSADEVSHTALLNALSISELVQVVSLQKREGRWFYQLQYEKGRHPYWPAYFELFDANTGDAESMSKNIASALAWQSISTDYRAAISQNAIIHSLSAQLLVPPIYDLPNEYNRVWQLKLADIHNTAVYLNADNGDFIAHVNDTTRWRNLLLMLHFMDYLPHSPEQGAFNNVFIKVMSLFALALSLTGMAWLLSVLRESILRRKSESLLLDTLIASDQLTVANCGGGGTCGLCTVVSPAPPAPSDREKILLSQADLDQGIRLACQHKVSEMSGFSIFSRK